MTYAKLLVVAMTTLALGGGAGGVTGGTGGTVVKLSDIWSIRRLRGRTTIDGVVYPAKQVYLTFDQDMTQFTRKQEGGWWKCNESWEWRITDGIETIDNN